MKRRSLPLRLDLLRLEDRSTPSAAMPAAESFLGLPGHTPGCGCAVCHYAQQPEIFGPVMQNSAPPVFATPGPGTGGLSTADFPNTPITNFRADGLPILNSRPGAPVNIFLDFDGGTSTLGNTTYTPYDTDGTATTFAGTELTDIIECWRHISVYFASYNVNVTTIYDSAKPTNWTSISNSISGGYSYLQFPTTQSASFNQGSDGRNRQSGIAHEIGHNFSLQHQSDYSLDGTKINEYSVGDNNLHVPLMGVDFGGQFPKFFHGRPSNSTTGFQDDYAVVAARIVTAAGAAAAGDGYAPDDFTGSLTAPAAFEDAFGMFHRTAVIERVSDVDAFAFTSAGGNVAVTLFTPDPSALDGVVEVYNSSQTLVARADSATSNSQFMTLNLPAGSYTFAVRSAGDYADAGVYQLAVRPLPADWATSDVGTVGLTGYAAAEAGGTWRLGGAGSAIGGTADSFRFAYQRLSGDGSITARVPQIENVSSNTRVGVMVRESLANNSRYAFAGMFPVSASGATFSSRATVGGTATTASSSPVGVPEWVRVTRVGNVLTGSHSQDGVTWTQIGTNTIALGTVAYVGLAVSSASTSSVSDSSFDNVTLAGTLLPGDVPAAFNTLPAPATPAVVNATGTGQTVSWAAVINATGYTVERSADGATWASVGTTAAGVTTLATTPPSGGRTWFYRVAANDASGTSVRSAVVSAQNRPDPPREVVVSRPSGSTTAVLTWVDNPGNTGYRIERSTNGGAFSTAANLTGSLAGWTNTGLTTGSQYAYRVFAVNAAGDSAFAAVDTARIAYTAGLTYTQNFDGLPNTGSFSLLGGQAGLTPVDLSTSTISAAGTGPSGWWIGKSGGSVQFAVDTGSSGTNGAKSYGPSGGTDRALGSLAGGTVPNIGVVFTNTTGGTLTSFTLTYTVEQWRRGNNTSGDVLQFGYIVNGADINYGTYTLVPQLNATSPNLLNGAGNIDRALDGNLAANRRTVSATVAVNWPANQSLTIRWADTNSVGNDDGLAIDDLTFTASGTVLAITSDGSGDAAALNVPDAATRVTTVTSTTLAAGTTRTYSISGGADASLFAINSSNGALTFVSPMYFETPVDANGNNVYEVTVRVAAGAAADTQTLSVTVQNVAAVAVARNDTYTTTQTAPIVVAAAAGVLANDRTATTDRVTILSDGFEAPALRPYQSATESAGDGTDWTTTLPQGWTSSVSATTPVGNPTEFYGWRIHDVDSWSATEGNGGRSNFTLGGIGSRGKVFVADGDAYDDGTDIDGTGLAMNAYLLTPAISLGGIAANSVKLAFDSAFGANGTQTAKAQYTLDGGTTWVDLLSLSTVSATNNAYSFDVPNGTTGNVQFRFAYELAANNLYWAIDDVRVTATRVVAADPVVVAAPVGGALSLSNTGAFTYTPFAGFSGVDSFLYRVNGGANLAKVTLTVTPATTRYADDAWAGLTAGTAVADMDPVLPGAQAGAVGTNAFGTVSAALAATPAGGVTVVNAGTFAETASITAAVTVAFQEGATTIAALDDTVSTAVVRLNGIALTVGNTANQQIDGVIAGTGSIVKNGSGTLTLTAANTYTGTTTVSAGVLSTPLMADGGLPSGIGASAATAGNLTIRNSATLRYTGLPLTTDRSLTVATTGGTIDVAAGTNLTLGGTVAGSLPFTKTGAGTLTLAAAGTTTQSTTVNGGLLSVTNTTGSATGTGTLTVAAAGAFGGTGIVTSTIAVNGTIAPGVGTVPGALSTGTVGSLPGGVFAFDMATAAADRIAVSGSVALGGATLAVNLAAGNNPATNTAFTVIDNDGTDAVTGTFAGLPEGSLAYFADRTFRVSYVGGSGNDVTLTYLGVTTPATVEAVIVNGGDAQRSRVTTIAVRFDSPVSLAAGAFTLSGFDPFGVAVTPPVITVSASVVGGKTVATLTFSGAGTEFGSLGDGRYVLSVDPTKVTKGSVAMAVGYSTPASGAGRIHRLYGDATGNAAVEFSDYVFFDSAFGSIAGDADFRSDMDFDQNGAIEFADYVEFNARFGVVI